MAGETLIVYREYFGRFEEVGRLLSTEGEMGFSYSEDYLQSGTAQAISRVLPLQAGAFPAKETRSFFDGILPEGSMRKNLSRVFRADANDTRAFMARLNDESAGALVFKGDGELPGENRGYDPLAEGDLERFAKNPREFAPRTVSRSRLSLAGAQMKVGLFLDNASGRWFYPRGTAPSSHIVKACDGSFPGQTANEAICMRAAANLGFETAACRLIPAAGQEPLIAVERFDRVEAGDAFLHRLHQEDFLQALPDHLDKYEPKDGHYANHCAWIIDEESRNPLWRQETLVLALAFRLGDRKRRQPFEKPLDVVEQGLVVTGNVAVVRHHLHDDLPRAR